MTAEVGTALRSYREALRQHLWERAEESGPGAGSDAALLLDALCGTEVALVSDAALDRDRTFMIGNSPRSDINPALKAGLRAVYIPHPHTWVQEQEPLDLAGERMIVLSSFPRLLDVF